MIYLDPRTGSKELLPYFKPYDVQVIDDVYLDAADLAFTGNGPSGPCLVGFERKVLTDAISSMREERFSGEQLGKLLRMYDFFSVLVEGIWRVGPVTGAIEVKGHGRGEWFAVRAGQRPVMFRELDHWLATLEHVVGQQHPITVARTSDPAQTVAYVVSRYKWWNDKEWNEHKSFSAIYSPNVPPPANVRRGFNLPQPGPVEEVSCRFPGVKNKAWSFGRRFESVHQMVNADEKELAEVEGVGKKMARTIYEWLRRKRAGNGTVGEKGWDD